MTKNVGIELAKKPMKAMGIRFAEGRSEAAAKLHSVELKDAWQVAQQGAGLSMVKVHKIFTRSTTVTARQYESRPARLCRARGLRSKITGGDPVEHIEYWMKSGPGKHSSQ